MGNCECFYRREFTLLVIMRYPLSIIRSSYRQHVVDVLHEQKEHERLLFHLSLWKRAHVSQLLP